MMPKPWFCSKKPENAVILLPPPPFLQKQGDTKVGKETAPDLAKAKALYEQAAKAGYQPARTNWPSGNNAYSAQKNEGVE